MNNKFDVIILAADMGEAMNSALPKAVHKAAGKELINWVIDAADDAGAQKVTAVVEHGREHIEKAARTGTFFAVPEEGLGTGAEINAAVSHIESEICVILYGDRSLITANTISGAVCELEKSKLATLILTADGEGKAAKINSGMFVFSSDELKEAALKMKGEYGFEDVVEALASEGKAVGSLTVSDIDELMAVNDRVALAKADKILRRRINERHMLSGVTIIDPERTYISDEVTIGRDSVILPGCMLSGKTVIGEGCEIGPDTTLENAIIGDGTRVQKTVGMDCVVNTNTTVGPFAYLRPGTVVGDNCRIGDFVEIKNSAIGNGTKVSHLTYVGDSDVGERVNFGCGTVTVNYDGAKKYRTTIGNDVFVGCNSNLVAPVTLEDGAYTAAGSTITDRVPEGSLAIARARQVNKEKWNDRRKNK